MKRVLSVLAAVMLVAGTNAQVSPSLLDFSRPALDWYQIETDHFVILFHMDESGQGASRSAQVAARVAEEVYGPITSLYEHEPDGKVHIILKDYEDYSNGAAYFFDNKIEIWAPALNSPLRGAHDWMRNVITHEFIHIVQVQAAMKSPRRWPLGYLQVLDYEDVRRPDVLYGYPNVIVSYPVIGLNNPAWFAEGTAQYQHDHLHYDRWDSHRDMLLRTRVLEGKALSLTELGSFYSKSSLMREGVYNHGFAFTLYLARVYGVEVLAQISDYLRSWRIWRVEEAIEQATGVPGQEVYESWLQELNRSYVQAVSPIKESLAEGTLVEPEGFANYFPRFSPDGLKLAYISNKGEHFGRTSLYVQDLSSGSVVAHDLGEAFGDYICSLGHRIKSNVTGAAAWRPDGQAFAYARQRVTSEGFLYTDLHLIDLDTEKSSPLTRDARASQPAWDSTGTRIMYVTSDDGSSNLQLLNLETGEGRPITRFANGTQVTSPVWHGEWIYFARLDPGAHGNDLWRVKADGSELAPVLQTSADERSPAIANGMLYYASDESGIYNIYRFKPDGSEQLTQVIGGAFMPDVSEDGRIAYATYRWDGYKIAILEHPATIESTIQYAPPEIITKIAPPTASENDGDIRAIDPEVLSSTLDREPALGTDSLQVSRYGANFTSFSFSPVVRLDQYVERRLEGRVRGRAETFWRNLKFGTYVSSREMLEGMSLFGGLLIGPGSHQDGQIIAPANILALERDVFLQFNYSRGFGFLPGRWSPQIAIELYNIQRQVENGLSIDEHPCTACLPESTNADLTYGLWEGNIYLRSKINRSTVLEAGYRYSPYRVTTNRFYSKELTDWIPSTSSRYFIGRSYMAGAYFEARRSHRESDIMRTGLSIAATYERETGELLRQFDVEEGQLVPVYDTDVLHRMRVNLEGGIRLPGQVRGTSHGLSIRVQASTLFGKNTDSFYFDYVGGLSGARGYPFYALGGTETLWVQAAWTLPLIPDIRRQIGPVYLDKVFMRLYADGARVQPASQAIRKDMGAELRLMMGSYYLLPTALFVSATYGMDAFEVELDDVFVTSQPSVDYGKELQWHFGLLFGFDL
ncbi:MAG: DUF5050 domain-containing protein [Bacteroidetes bacterium]|nr:DUF5050 domain-containing protein [Bacteroidota bacterium]MDE2672396.1 DUF5050 domain-containing protein [Bacteroidota bacterium]